MSRRAAEITSTTRKAYVQSNLISSGIQLADLRDIVAATADYDDFSHVLLERKRVTVTEHKSSPWRKRGREES